jgi:hypothetical protein
VAIGTFTDSLVLSWNMSRQNWEMLRQLSCVSSGIGQRGDSAHAPPTYLRPSSGAHSNTIDYVLNTSKDTQESGKRR